MKDVDFWCPECEEFQWFGWCWLVDLPYHWFCDNCESWYYPLRCEVIEEFDCIEVYPCF